MGIEKGTQDKENNKVPSKQQSPVETRTEEQAVLDDQARRYLGNSYLQTTSSAQSDITRGEDRLIIQPKLTMNQPGDKYEQEADRIADLIVQMPETLKQNQQVSNEGKAGNGDVKEQISPLDRSRTDLSQSTPLTTDLESRVNNLMGGGMPLSESVRTFFEPRFGCEFSHVRLHTNLQAAESAYSLNANAFTVGRDIVLGRGQYMPDTLAGRRLLAHELTHVVQQKPASHNIQLQPMDVSQKAPQELSQQYSPVISEPFTPEGHPKPGKNKPKISKVDARKRFDTVLADDFVDTVQLRSILNMRDAFIIEFGVVLNEIDNEERLEREWIAAMTAPITAIPFVGSAAHIWLNQFLDNLNRAAWDTVRELLYALKYAVPDAKVLIAKTKEGGVKDFDRFRGDTRFKEFFEKQYASFDWKSKNLDDFETHLKIHEGLHEIYNSYIELYGKQYWKEKFYETIGGSLKIAINRLLLAKDAYRVAATSSRFLLEKFGSIYKLKTRQRVFKIVYYKTLSEAVVLTPRVAIEKWNPFLSYCVDKGVPEGGDDEEIVQIYDAASRHHYENVRELCEQEWRAIDEESQRYYEARRLAGERRGAGSRDLCNVLEGIAVPLVKVLREEQRVNIKYDFSEIEGLEKIEQRMTTTCRVLWPTRGLWPELF